MAKRIGTDITIQELRKEYDAVLITIGASTDKSSALKENPLKVSSPQSASCVM